MNTLKVSKWFTFTLLCLTILSATMALVGLGAAQGLQDRSSQPELIQEEGEQIDMLLPGEKAPQTAPDNGTGQEGIYLAGGAKAIDPSGRIPTGGIAALDPSNGGRRIPAGVRPTIDPYRNPGTFFNPADGMYEYIPAGVRPTIDPYRNPGTFFNPADGMLEYVPAGHAVALDPSGRIRGIALVHLANGSPVRILARGTVGSNPDDEDSSFLTSSIIKRPRRHKEK